MNYDYINAETWNDRWVVEEVFLGMRKGFCVEAGVCDGVGYSPTYVLEKEFEWTGILVEPNPVFFERGLENDRPNFTCVNKGLAGENKTVDFYCIDNTGGGYNGFPSLNSFGEKGWWDKVNSVWPDRSHMKIPIECVTLYDLLKENNAPDTIDYLSLDIEGAELNVLKTFPFNEYRFKAVSIEFSPRELTTLLVKNGYIPVINPFCEVYHEDYFIHKEHIDIRYKI